MRFSNASSSSAALALLAGLLFGSAAIAPAETSPLVPPPALASPPAPDESPVSFAELLEGFARTTGLEARFEEAFIRAWNGLAEDDGYNRLILSAGLSWREVSVLRAIARYMRQIRFGFLEGQATDRPK